MNRNLLITLGILFIGIWLAPVSYSQSFSELNTPLDSTATAETNTQTYQDPNAYGQNFNPSSSQGVNHEISSKEYAELIATRHVNDKNSTYTLGPTDVIEISVLRHPEVSGKYILNTEGKIQYEFIGDVTLSGKTKEEAADLLTKTLSTYIVNPQVTVKISEYNSKIVYVVGEVARPGRIIMRGDTITIREALLEAGLPLLTANTTHSTMFTPTAGKVKQRIVDVHALLFKGDLRQNYIMKPGDTLYVPATFWAKATRVISPVAQPIGQAASTGATVTTGIP